MGIIRSIDYIPFKPTTGTSAMSIDAPNQPPATQLINDAWFRGKVQQALDDPRPALDAKDVETHFSKRRAKTRQKLLPRVKPNHPNF